MHQAAHAHICPLPYFATDSFILARIVRGTSMEVKSLDLSCLRTRLSTISSPESANSSISGRSASDREAGGLWALECSTRGHRLLPSSLTQSRVHCAQHAPQVNSRKLANGIMTFNIYFHIKNNLWSICVSYYTTIVCMLQNDTYLFFLLMVCN